MGTGSTAEARPIDAEGPVPTTSRAAGWAEFRGVPFVKGEADPTDIHESDPRSGAAGDGHLIAGLIAVARTHPELLRALIVDKGGGEYEITLRGLGRYLLVFSEDAKVRVDQRLPVDVSGEPAYAQRADHEERDGTTVYELWPMLLERAYAQHRGGYDRIEEGTPETVFTMVGARTRTHDLSNMRWAEIERIIDGALKAGQPVTVNFFVNIMQGDLGARWKELGLIANHDYVLTERRGGGWVLVNPWGSSHPTQPVTAEDLSRWWPVLRVGEL
jgi:hypothetical protein